MEESILTKEERERVNKMVNTMYDLFNARRWHSDSGNLLKKEIEIGGKPFTLPSFSLEIIEEPKYGSIYYTKRWKGEYPHASLSLMLALPREAKFHDQIENKIAKLQKEFGEKMEIGLPKIFEWFDEDAKKRVTENYNVKEIRIKTQSEAETQKALQYLAELAILHEKLHKEHISDKPGPKWR
jgi:hypothetical protein